MTLDFVIDVLIDILLLPLQIILVPIDTLLAQIPGIGIIASSISAIASFIGSLPSTLVNLVGLSPILWNAYFLTFILFVTLSPAINILKRVWAWVRP